MYPTGMGNYVKTGREEDGGVPGDRRVSTRMGSQGLSWTCYLTGDPRRGGGGLIKGLDGKTSLFLRLGETSNLI